MQKKNKLPLGTVVQIRLKTKSIQNYLKSAHILTTQILTDTHAQRPTTSQLLQVMQHRPT